MPLQSDSAKMVNYIIRLYVVIMLNQDSDNGHQPIQQKGEAENRRERYSSEGNGLTYCKLGML